MKRNFYFLLLILMSCSSSKVIIDYDKQINFSNFRNYQFYEDVGKGLNDLDVKRVTKTIIFQMQQKGFTKSDNPDFYINLIAEYDESQNNNTIAVGFGSGGRNGGFGISGGIPIGNKILNEELTLEFVNAKTNEIIWEATLVSKVKEKRKPERKVVHFKEVIAKILDKYPPR